MTLFFFLKEIFFFRSENTSVSKMSHNKIPKWINLIEEHISKKHIKCYEYNNFSNLKVIGTGGFGKVYRANWKSSHSTLALKPFNDATADKIVYEIVMQYILIVEPVKPTAKKTDTPMLRLLRNKYILLLCVYVV